MPKPVAPNPEFPPEDSKIISNTPSGVPFILNENDLEEQASPNNIHQNKIPNTQPSIIDKANLTEDGIQIMNGTKYTLKFKEKLQILSFLHLEFLKTLKKPYKGDLESRATAARKRDARCQESTVMYLLFFHPLKN